MLESVLLITLYNKNKINLFKSVINKTTVTNGL